MLLLWTEVTKRKPGGANNPHGIGGKSGKQADSESVNHDNVMIDNITLPKAEQGNSKEYGLRKLQKAAAEGNEEAAVPDQPQDCSMISFERAIISRMSFCSSRPFAPRDPWIVTAARHRALPSAVFGPVEAPPCMRQRPFAIAKFLQGVPLRVLAPQTGTDDV